MTQMTQMLLIHYFSDTVTHYPFLLINIVPVMLRTANVLQVKIDILIHRKVGVLFKPTHAFSTRVITLCRRMSCFRLFILQF